MTASPKNQNEHPLIGQGAILLCAILWSTSGLFIKLIDWHPMTIFGIRSLIAALFMLCVRFFYTASLKRAKPGEAGQSNKSKKIPLWAGAFAYSMTMLTFVIANKNTTAANAIVLQYSAPVWAALLGWLLIKEKPHWEHWIALAAIFGGFGLFFRDSFGSAAFLGDGLAFLSGIFFGAHSVIMRMQKDANPADSMILAHIVSFVISIPFLFIYPPEISSSTTISMFYMGIIQIGCASLLYSYGIKKITAIQTMLTATIEPLLSPVWVLIVTGEKPAFFALIGGSIILASVLFTMIIGNRRSIR